MKKSQLPKWTFRFLEKIIDPFLFDGIYGDLLERYHQMETSYGKKKARRQFIWNTLGFLRYVRLFKRRKHYSSILIRPDMLKNYLTAFIRNTVKDKWYSLIVFSGLTMGICLFILIMSYVYFEFNFERHLHQPEQIYRVYKEQPSGAYKNNSAYAVTQFPLGPFLKDNFSEIDEYSRLINYNMLIRNNSLSSVEEVFGVDPSALDLFSFELIRGRGLSDKNPKQMLMSESMADRFFWEVDPLGQSVTLGDSLFYEVVGIFKDPPANTHLQVHAMIPVTWIASQRSTNLWSWQNSSFSTYVRLGKGAEEKSVEEKIQNALMEVIPDSRDDEGNPAIIFKFQAIKDIHLQPGLNFDWQVASNPLTIRIFGIIAFVILGLACINYINLSIARSGRRASEIGVRKIVGAEKGELIFQFLFGTVIISYISFIVAFAMAHLLLPYAVQLLEHPFDIGVVYQPKIIVAALLFPLVLGLLAGLYPAMIIASFKPIQVLKNQLALFSQKSRLHNSLILIQFAISTILIISTLVVAQQLQFIHNKKMGFDREQIIGIRLRDTRWKEKSELIRSQLMNHSNIQEVAFSWRFPNNINSQTSINWEGGQDQYLSIYFNPVDQGFTRLYDIELIDGEDFSNLTFNETEAHFLVNEEAVRQMGIEDPVGQVIYRGSSDNRRDEGRIVGVIKNFHQHDLTQPYRPVYFKLENSENLSQLSIKISPDNITQSIDFIKQTLSSISDQYPFEYVFFDEVFGKAYQKESRLLLLFSWFSIIAIFIACLGFIAMVAYITSRRRKEIGIRKVVGASGMDILILLTRKFLQPILGAIIIALPLAYLAMSSWLKEFAFHIKLQPGIFVVAVILIFMMVILLISVQTWKTISTSPVKMISRE